MAPDLTPWLHATPLLDFHAPAIAAVIEARGWRALAEEGRVRAAYEFVRDEIAFGYNRADDIPASRVLADGLGQCNTKGTLLMAFFRALGLPCRLHGFTVDKRLQRGAVTGLFYLLAPREILHSWVEVLHAGHWLNLEGFILDGRYLAALQRRFPVDGAFCGYGAATDCLAAPPVAWSGGDTYIQHRSIVRDFGVFDDPDSFYRRHGTNLSGLRRWLFAHRVRDVMNRNVRRIRRGGP